MVRTPDGVMAKVRKTEEFIESHLKVQLKSALDERDHVYETISKYLELKNTIENLQQNDMKTMEAQVNMGSDFYMQALVPDTSRILVDIGMGFHAEFTLVEAVEFINNKEAQLLEKSEALSLKAAQIKGDIKVCLELVRELLMLSQPPTRRK